MIRPKCLICGKLLEDYDIPSTANTCKGHDTTQNAANAAFLHDAVRQFLEAWDKGEDCKGLVEYMRRSMI